MQAQLLQGGGAAAAAAQAKEGAVRLLERSDGQRLPTVVKAFSEHFFHPSKNLEQRYRGSNRGAASPFAFRKRRE